MRLVGRVLTELKDAMFGGNFELALDGPEGNEQPEYFIPKTPTEMLSDEEEYDEENTELVFDYGSNGFVDDDAEETEERTQVRSATKSQREAGRVVIDLVRSDDEETDSLGSHE